MNENSREEIAGIVDATFRAESRRILATLIRLLGDFGRAEDALQDAFSAAMEQWPRDGVPANPRAWLISAGRFKAIDRLRKSSRPDPAFEVLVDELAASAGDPLEEIDNAVKDDQLRLVFTCCHPALSLEARIALTLREVCGLTTEEIASAFLATPSTLAQRIVRAKAKIRDARIPYRVPSADDLPDRLDAVLRVVYLVYNEGYAASSGASLTRPDLSGEAIRLGRLLMELLPPGSGSDWPRTEVAGLLALMLIQESRREARTTLSGDVILLEDQDRSRWNQEYIREGKALVELVFASDATDRSRRIGPYTIQAAIAALHAEAPDSASTDWGRIIGFYDMLMRVEPSPVVELNRAVGVAMRDGPAAGLELIDNILARGDLANYYLAHSTRADLCRRLGRKEEARSAYRKALDLAQQEPARRFLGGRLKELE